MILNLSDVISVLLQGSFLLFFSLKGLGLGHFPTINTFFIFINILLNPSSRTLPHDISLIKVILVSIYLSIFIIQIHSIWVNISYFWLIKDFWALFFKVFNFLKFLFNLLLVRKVKINISPLPSLRQHLFLVIILRIE